VCGAWSCNPIIVLSFRLGARQSLLANCVRKRSVPFIKRFFLVGVWVTGGIKIYRQKVIKSTSFFWALIRVFLAFIYAASLIDGGSMGWDRIFGMTD
jgi:hypothetical protein